MTAPDGSIHALVSGQRVNSNTDPNAGLNEVVGPGSWALGARAFGSASITVASNADVQVVTLGDGRLVSVWTTAAAMLFQVGVDPGTPPQFITPPADPPTNHVAAADPTTGDVVIAYHGVGSGSNFFRRLLPSLGEPQPIPQSREQGPSIAARSTGGVFTAYSPDGTKVRLLRFGGPARAVPVPKGVRILAAGLATGPEGRLWVFYGNEQATYATRTNKAVTRFEPVQRLKSPPGTVQYFRLEGEGSAGRLDLFTNVTVDGATKDGSYHRQVRPALSLTVATQGRKVTVRVTDAGDPVGGAAVAGLPGGAKTTGGNGTIVLTVADGASGSFKLTAKKAGYVPSDRQAVPLTHAPATPIPGRTGACVVSPDPPDPATTGMGRGVMQHKAGERRPPPTHAPATPIPGRTGACVALPIPGSATTGKWGAG